MKVHDRFLLFVYCGLLFTAGVVFGFLFGDGFRVKVVDYIGVLSGLATIAAAITAVKALNAWHSQFKHSKKYEVALRFRDSLDRGFCDNNYVISLLNYKRAQYAPKNNNDLTGVTGLKEKKDAAHEAWIAQGFKVENAWRDLEMLMSESDQKFFECTPPKVRNYVYSVCVEIYKIADSYSTEEVGDLYFRVDKYCGEIRSMHCALDKSVGLLLRSLVN